MTNAGILGLRQSVFVVPRLFRNLVVLMVQNNPSGADHNVQYSAPLLFVWPVSYRQGYVDVIV